MVEQVEELSPELQVHAFAEGEREVLDKGKIRVHETGPVDWSTGRSAEFTDRKLWGVPELNVNAAEANAQGLNQFWMVWI